LLLRQINTSTFGTSVGLSSIAITNDGIMYAGSTQNNVIYIYDITTNPETLRGNFSNITPTFLRYNPANQSLWVFDEGDGTNFITILDKAGNVLNSFVTTYYSFIFDRYGNLFALYSIAPYNLSIYNEQNQFIVNVTGIPSSFSAFTVTPNGVLVIGTSEPLIVTASLPITYPDSGSIPNHDTTNSATNNPLPFRDSVGFPIIIGLVTLVGIAIVAGFILVYIKNRRRTKKQEGLTVDKPVSFSSSSISLGTIQYSTKN